jgi:type VI secretion system protein ImpH
MAGQDGGSSVNLKLDLLKEGHTFSFFQVMRLLRFFGGRLPRSKDAPSVDNEHTRIRPELSFAFPPADVSGIKQSESDPPDYLVTATFLGLYGTSSPLPAFYTEDLMDEAREDESVTRDFMDIIGHRLYVLLFRCWTKYRQFVQVAEERNHDDLQRLFSLIGLGEREFRRDIPDVYGLIRYIGLLTQFPRSALGLKTMLQDALADVPVNVEPCILRKAKIPPDQRLCLGESGCTLATDSFIGEQIDDRMGKFRLVMGPLKSQAFQQLLPGTPDCEKAAFLTRFYLTDPLEYDMELILAEKEAQCTCLGASEWSRLGWDTWCFSGSHLGEVRVWLNG